MNISINITPEDVARDLTYDQCFEWIKAMDDQVAEYDFTLRLAKRFVQVIKDEIEGDRSTNLNKELGLE